MIKVDIDGKEYCVETLIFENERLKKEVIASAELYKMLLYEIRAEIDKLPDLNPDYPMDRTIHVSKWAVFDIIDKYREVSK